MTEMRGEPILRLVPRPADINANGHIFGGWVLSQMDIAAGIVASRRAQGPVATVAIEAMEFILDKMKGTKNNAEFFDMMRRGGS